MDVAIIFPFFNPCGYKILSDNAEMCIQKLLEQHVKPSQIFLSVCNYTGEAFEWVGNEGANKITSQLKKYGIHIIHTYSNSILFHKESLINIAEKRIPQKFTKILALDADILFEDKDWLNILSTDLQEYKVIQPFADLALLDMNQNVVQIKSGWIKEFQFNKNSVECTQFKAHGGSALAFQRSFFKLIGGLFDGAIIGSGDEIHMRVFANIHIHTKKFEYIIEELEKYKEKVFKIIYENDFKNIIGYSMLNIKHLFHGDLKNRKYVERHLDAMRVKFSLKQCIKFSSQKLPEFINKDWNAYFLQYFQERKDGQICFNNNSNFIYANIKNLIRKYCCLQKQLFICKETDCFVDVHTGLFNRLRVLCAAYFAVSQTSSGIVWCHWPLNEECSVPFSDIATLKDSFGRKSCDVIKFISNDKRILVAKQLHMHNIFGPFNPEHASPGPLAVLKNIRPPDIPDSFKLLFRNVIPSSKIMDIVQTYKQILGIHPNNHCVGLHIRRTDALKMAKKIGKSCPSLRDFIDFAESCLAKTNIQKIILCTDDENIVSIFEKKFQNEELMVVADPRSLKNVTTKYGKRKNGHFEIMAAALILSECKEFMGTEVSSVTQFINFFKT
jgi:hypothetical protein